MKISLNLCSYHWLHQNFNRPQYRAASYCLLSNRLSNRGLCADSLHPVRKKNQSLTRLMIHTTISCHVPTCQQDANKATFFIQVKSITCTFSSPWSNNSPQMETASLPVTQVHLPLPPVLTAASSVSGLPDQMSRVLRGYQTRQWTSCCWPRKCRLPRKHSFPVSG